MPNAAAKAHDQRTTDFWVEGITCLDCAAKFERNVAALPGVAKATLNHATGRLTVVGEADLQAIQALGKAENYNIHSAPRQREGDHQRSFVQPELIRAAVSGLALLAAAVMDYAGGFADVWVIVLYILAALTGGWGNARKALYSLPRLDFNISVLMTIAVIGAMLIGEWSEGALVAFLFAVSEMLESWTFTRARRSIRELMDAAPRVATVRRNGEEVSVDVESVQIGDVMIVRPGEKISLDGIIIKGTSSIDEAPITGESVPVEKGPGEMVYAGTLNTFGALEVRVTKRAEDTAIARILALVEEAQTKRASSEAFVDRFAAVYTPIVMALAGGIAVIPPLVLGLEWSEWIYRGLALLVVACPCALVVSTPVVVVSAISNAARHGVLIKGGIHLEEAASVVAVAFDKTGTLTEGKPVVTDIIPAAGWTAEQLLQTAMSVEMHSEHPLAKAVIEAGKQHALVPMEVDRFQAITGRGVIASVKGTEVVVGSERFFNENGYSLDDFEVDIKRLQSEGKTVMLVGTEQALLGLLAIADQPRAHSRETMRALKDTGVKHTVMLTGDNELVARHVADVVGIDTVMAGLLPDDKAKAVQQLEHRYGKIAMVGDGINDAPALATATVGIAMGSAGTDAALETADIALMADDLTKLPYIIRLSRKALRVIKQNIYFAVLIKLVAILAVFPGWLTLWLAILSDMGATVLVTLNGMRLLSMRRHIARHGNES